MRKILLGLLCLVAVCIVLVPTTLTANAQEVKLEEENVETEIANEINMMEEELAEQDTDVISELQKQITYYQEMLLTTDSIEKREQINSLINTTVELIDEYESYSNSAMTRGSFHLIYTPSVAVVIGYFNSKGYTLAAELLTHARDNDDLDSIYVPIHGNYVLASSVYSQIINNSTTSGSASFPNSGGTLEEDLYYAIHSFYYRKSVSGNTIVIQDRYDYEAGEYSGSIGGIAVNIMAAAQNAGVLVPFYSEIKHDYSGTLVNQIEQLSISTFSEERYTERIVTLGKGEYKDFITTFSTSGTKVIQTLGIKDAYLYIYDENGTLLTSNDDSGYGLNSLISFYFYSNTQYKIRVKFWSLSESGNIKLIITPSLGALNSESSSLSTYESIYKTQSANFTFNTFAQLNRARLFIYQPTTTAEYTIKTESSLDTYIYLLDPRSTYPMSFDKVSPCIYNDDAGEGYNASITKELSKDIQYLVVYSTYNIRSQSGDLALKINKV